MSALSHHARRLLLPAAIATLLAAPMHAQAAGGTGGTAGAGTTTTSDTVVHQTQESHGFPWGLLGLLGLAGLLKRPQRETVVQRDTTTTARPGDPNYRV